MPIPFISTLLSAIAFNLIIFDSTGSSLDNTDAASSTISLIKALGSFAKATLEKFVKNKNITKIFDTKSLKELKKYQDEILNYFNEIKIKPHKLEEIISHLYSINKESHSKWLFYCPILNKKITSYLSQVLN